MRMDMNRRDFLKIAAATAGSAAIATITGCKMAPVMSGSEKGTIQTVRGRIKPSDFGFALVHEHILVDFIGADKVSPDRYDAEDVFRVMLPKLMGARQRGIMGFVDCTPAYIGRDVRLLRRLADAANMHILTPTGYYGAANDKFVPAHAYTDSVDQLAGRWIIESEKGIDGTDIHPGFIKIGVDPIDSVKNDINHGLSEIDAKLVRAAARTHKRTGLPVASHTGQGAAALAQIAIFEDEGVNLPVLIVVHADGESDQSYDANIAGRGSWLEFDGVMGRPSEYYAARIKAAAKYEDRILISMDAGWYEVGKAGGGNIRDYNYLPDMFLPALRKNGIGEQTIHRLTVLNPARAFAIY
jgi:predicted metal-dependent phosphotriesterase family hydrolase